VKVAKRRVAEAEETGAKYLATACPFCLRNLKDAVEAIPSAKIEVLDVLELASRALDS
jgi:heterodisulfide reductase subunit D